MYREVRIRVADVQGRGFNSEMRDLFRRVVQIPGLDRMLAQQHEALRAPLRKVMAEYTLAFRFGPRLRVRKVWSN